VAPAGCPASAILLQEVYCEKIRVFKAAKPYLKYLKVGPSKIEASIKVIKLAMKK
jgi:hypothetical protein